jgi:hypothetical protein
MSMSQAEPPGAHEGVFAIASAFTNVMQAMLNTKTNYGNALPSQAADKYDPVTRSWEGSGGFRYMVPLTDLPGEIHARSKVRQVRILMDNMRTMCVNDMLPCTPEEKQFWTQYRYLKYQLFMSPFLGSLSVFYLGAKVAFNLIPHALRGRTMPFVMASVFAEQWMEVTFPVQELLHTAMTAKTPLGDAARADWQRLQPTTITLPVYSVYNWRLMLGDPLPGLAFGGNVRTACD